MTTDSEVIAGAHLSEGTLTWKRFHSRLMLGNRKLTKKYRPGHPMPPGSLHDRLRVECIAVKNAEVPVKRNNVATIVVMFWGDI